MVGLKRDHNASIRNTLFSLAAVTIARTSEALTPNGFSQSTALPAFMAAMLKSAWEVCGVAK